MELSPIKRTHSLRATTFLAILILFSAPPDIGQQTSQADSVATIRALERDWTVGQSRNDNGALNLIFDNQIVYVEYGNLVTKGEYLSRIKTQPSYLDEIVQQSINVHIFGNTAVVDGTYVEIQRKGDKRSSTKWRYLDTWVYKQNGWVLVAAGATPVSE